MFSQRETRELCRTIILACTTVFNSFFRGDGVGSAKGEVQERCAATYPRVRVLQLFWVAGHLVSG
jgi:hypothetical protein